MRWKKIKKRPISFFVSIGAGLNQIPLIVEAKRQGFHVIGVDFNAQAPGFIKCDLKIQESIENYQEIYQKLREFLFDGEINGVMTKSYGSAIKSVSYLAEKFNLPFLPYNRCDDFIDKDIMKSIFDKNEIPNPKLYSIRSKSKLGKLTDDDFPLISKPKIGHAKIDVKLINSINELKTFFDKGKRNSVSIFERFIQGDEIISAGIIHNGIYSLIDITDKKTTPKPYFVDIMHTSPSKYYHLSGKIVEIGQKIARAFEVTTAPLIMEFVVDDNEDLFLIEAVPEFGGEFLPDILIPSRVKYNFIGETIKAGTNRGFKEPVRKKVNSAVVVKYLTGENGILASCNPEGPKKIDGIIFSRIFKVIGSEVKEPHTNLDRLGVVVARGKSIDAAVAAADAAIESFNVRIKK